ncbi:hypothetical protein DPSP01_009113 [Paraphaeosphaeria sporulosa]|uniref:Zn(2)-C6 fungal-type domain-containing protein n=1 Tax=Paraphaeosphaeria sporulosa TaxID=1460663 RepID=A0A177C8F8_9PLEO|nr:uncharacterized protein CC84DRAFT_1249344 [Paraphaeosphaeria sporulosa]OAG03923.1 hypothetical protein CC84DRAFT_1249344 [Paraphaeosphaeria sporulosa]
MHIQPSLTTARGQLPNDSCIGRPQHMCCPFIVREHQHTMIPVTQKGANTCNYCRVRKQRCDRALPSCSRCTVKLRQCDYTWAKDVPPLQPALSSDSIPMSIGRHGNCGFDLTTRGQEELLHAGIACTKREPRSNENLSELVSDILDLSERKVSGMMEEHATSIHQWCPLIDEDLIREGRNGAYDDCSSDLMPSPLQLLCVFILSRRPCSHAEHVNTNILYTTIKQLLAIGQAAGDVSLDLFRAGMLTAVYECAHGLPKQAFVTLSTCAALFDLIKLSLRKPDRDPCNEEVVSSLNAAIIMLDRMIPLSSILESLPLVCPSRQTLSIYIASKIEPVIPAPSPTPYASSPRKVHIRAIVALESGRVSEYSHAAQLGVGAADTYDKVDAAVALVIKKLVDKPQPHTWLHCDAIAMAFCSHLLLQQTQIEQLKAQGTSTSGSVAAKALMALQYSRRMAWDMVHVMIQKIKKEEDLPYLPFAGVCCVIRAAIAVLETKQYTNEDAPNAEEVHNFLVVLSWFARRWSVGGEFASSTLREQ